jgi:hypothetical protein
MDTRLVTIETLYFDCPQAYQSANSMPTGNSLKVDSEEMILSMLNYKNVELSVSDAQTLLNALEYGE